MKAMIWPASREMAAETPNSFLIEHSFCLTSQSPLCGSPHSHPQSSPPADQRSRLPIRPEVSG